MRKEKTTAAGRPKGTANLGVTSLLGSTSAQPEYRHLKGKIAYELETPGRSRKELA